MCVLVCVSLKITELHEWACTTCGWCRHHVPVATSRPTKLIKRYSLALGYRSEAGRCALAHSSLSPRNFTGSQIERCESDSACCNAVQSGHTVKMEGYQKPVSACPGLSGDMSCEVCVFVCVCVHW